MPEYRRWRQPGGTYFFTLVAYERSAFLTSDVARCSLREAIRQTHLEHPFKVVATVLLPDHLHSVWELPPGDADFSTRWRLIKNRSRELWLANREIEPASPTVAGQDMWQPRFWEHWVRDTDDLKRHVDYIHYNPVKHGYTVRASDWPYSTFQRFVRMREYSEDWGQAEPATLRNWDGPPE